MWLKGLEICRWWQNINPNEEKEVLSQVGHEHSLLGHVWQNVIGEARCPKSMALISVNQT